MSPLFVFAFIGEVFFHVVAEFVIEAVTWAFGSGQKGKVSKDGVELDWDALEKALKAREKDEDADD